MKPFSGRDWSGELSQGEKAEWDRACSLPGDVIDLRDALDALPERQRIKAYKEITELVPGWACMDVDDGFDMPV